MIFVAILILVFTQVLNAQPNPVSNYGFEKSNVSVTDWTTTSHAGISSISTSNSHSGSNCYNNTYSSTSSTGYVESNSTIAVPNNNYLVIAGYYSVNNRQSTSRVQIGVSGNMSSAATPSSNNTYYLINHSVQNTSGSTQNMKVRINNYLSSGSQSRTFRWDNIIAYVSTSGTLDVTNPNAASSASVYYTSNSATLYWANGSDNTGGSGVQRTIILRTTGTCPGTAPTLNGQEIYSKAGGYGISTVGSWTVLDTVNISSSSYTDNTISSGTSYIYAIVHEDKAYNHSTPTMVYVPVGATSSPSAPSNNQTDVSAKNLALSWPSVCGAYSYDVYLSSVKSDVDNQVPSALISVSQTALSYTISTLLNGYTAYYWRVVPKNSEGNTATGCPTWKFTTGVQPLSYNISRSSNVAFNSIINSGNSFSWSSSYNADDQFSDDLNLTAIGFTGFYYQGQNITSLKANLNGFITFNTTFSSPWVNTFSSKKQIIAPFWDDLVCQGYMGPSSSQDLQLSQLQNTMKYLVTGEVGNQVLTIEWSEMEIYNNPGPSINFQLKLYENGNKIEFVYGKMYGFNGTVNHTYSYSIGISGSVVNSTPTDGQVIAQQYANVLNFNHTNTTNISELPDCYSSLLFVPTGSPGTYNASARAITNDECVNAITLPIHKGIQNDFCKVYSSKGATRSLATNPSGTADDDVWFKFTTTSAGNYGITINSSGGYNGVIQLFSGNCASLTSLGYVNATGNGLIENYVANGLVEGTYFIRIYDANSGTGGSGNFAISVYSIETPPANDNCSGAIALTIGTPYSSGSTANATASTGVPSACSGSYADDDVWFKFTATSTITKISADGGTAFNVVMQYFSGTCGSLTSLGCANITKAAGEESVTFASTIGTQYFIRVYHTTLGATPTTGFNIWISNPEPNCPTLSSPANNSVSINAGVANTFSWSASTLPTIGTKTYTIQIATNPTFTNLVTLTGATGITGTSYTLAKNTLNATTTYYWRVLAQNVNGVSEGCSYRTFSTTSSGSNVSCAQNLLPDSGSFNQSLSTVLSWSVGSGSPTSYDVYLSSNLASVTALSASVRVATGITANNFSPTLAYGTTYYWTVIPKKGGNSASACFINSFTTTVAPPANDNCSGAVTLNPLSIAPVSGSTLNATQSMSSSVGFANDDVWYKFTAASTSHNILVKAIGEFNPVVEIFNGNCSSLSSMLVINDKGNGQSESLTASGLTIGQTYYVRVYDFANGVSSSTDFTISINEIDLGVLAFVSPTTNNCGTTTVTVSIKNNSVATLNFATNPATISGSVLSPANVTTNFSNVVINTGTLAAGASTNVTLTTSYNVINSGNYYYTANVEVENDNNTNNNELTSLLQQIVLPDPFIVGGTTTACAGKDLTFTLSGSDIGVNYQLFKNDTAMSGVVSGTGSSIQFTGMAKSGVYVIIATDNATSCRSYMSANATITASPLWLGYNTNWNDPSNWCNNTIPATNANILISGSATYMPALPGNVTINNLELTEANKRIDLNGKKLTVNGKISGDGVLRGDSLASLEIIGNDYIGSLKMDQTTNGTTNSLANLTVNIGTGAAKDSITLGNALKLHGTLTVTNGTVVSNGQLTLVSNAAYTARVAALSSSADVKGNVVSQRYVPSIVRRYRMISPNTTSFSYNDLKDNIFVTGSGGATNGFDVSNPNSASIFTFQESTTGGRGWKAVTNINQTLAAGKGAIVYVRGDRTLPAPQWYTPPYVAQNAVTLDFVGTINKGNFSPAITYTNTGVVEDDGFNLVGNPYPSQIDWSLVTKSNLSPFFYVFDPSTNAYVAKSGSTQIASGQAIFVQATSASPSITFTESCKVANSPQYYFKTSNQPLTIKVVRDSINSDIAMLQFNSAASHGFNINEDALKFSNSSINMGFLVGGKQVQINTIPALSTVADTFTLFISAPSNSYQISFANFNDIPDSKGIFLRDIALNTLTNLRSNPVYSFNTSAVGGGTGNRFQLIITSQMGAVPVEFVSVKATQIAQTEDVNVTWVTATELNNEKFIVERSTDNKNFDAVGLVKGAGTSKTTNNYSFVDASAISAATANGSNKLYYRIRQVDFSGENKLSKTAVVELNKLNTTISEITVYPNPAKTYTEIHLGVNESLGKVVLYDIAGKKIQEHYEVSNKLTLDVSSLNSGIYFVKIGEHQTQKLVVE